jgi:hypothetical protein
MKNSKNFSLDHFIDHIYVTFVLETSCILCIYIIHIEANNIIPLEYVPLLLNR